MDHFSSLLKSQKLPNIGRPTTTREIVLFGIGIGISTFVLASFISNVFFGGDSYGACQTRCNLAAMACYAGAGFQFGAVTFGIGTPAALLACASAQGSCMALCAAQYL